MHAESNFITQHFKLFYLFIRLFHYLFVTVHTLAYYIIFVKFRKKKKPFHLGYFNDNQLTTTIENVTSNNLSILSPRKIRPHYKSIFSLEKPILSNIPGGDSPFQFCLQFHEPP